MQLNAVVVNANYKNVQPVKLSDGSLGDFVYRLGVRCDRPAVAQPTINV